jgi:glycogen operon protein
MLLAGDEFARTQKGNNNAYCQDNEISWVHWDEGERGKRLVDFTRSLIALRQKYPILRRVRWLTGAYDEELEVRDVTWIDANGEPMRDEQWADSAMRSFGMLIDGRAPETGIRRRGELATLLIVFNAWQDVVTFRLPEANGGSAWTLCLDTNMPAAPAESRFDFGHEYEATARSLILFQLA